MTIFWNGLNEVRLNFSANVAISVACLSDSSIDGELKI